MIQILKIQFFDYFLKFMIFINPELIDYSVHLVMQCESFCCQTHEFMVSYAAYTAFLPVHFVKHKLHNWDTLL